MIIILSILVYFLLLLALSWLTSRKADNKDFFSARHSSPWAMVAFGMIGASISGVTFVSVPGMVLSVQMTYLQMCMGYILGYFAVAFVLLPVYYRLRLTSIYTYLQGRLGARSYTTGASFFLIGKMTGSAVKFYVVCMILQRFVLDAYHVPFAVTVSSLVLLIWLYTRRGRHPHTCVDRFVSDALHPDHVGADHPQRDAGTRHVAPRRCLGRSS